MKLAISVEAKYARLRTSQRRPFGLAGIAPSERRRGVMPPYRDDGRGRDLHLRTLPLGNRMLGLRPMSKIGAARAAFAHIPTGRTSLLPTHIDLTNVCRYYTTFSRN